MRRVWIVIESSSAEVQTLWNDIGILGVYDNFESAMNRVDEWRDESKEDDYLEIGESYLDEKAQTFYTVVYKNGDEDSELWSEVKVLWFEVKN